jgi:hypothetical protein
MPEHVPTLADVCSAIADGRLAASSDGATYHVNALELRRYFNQGAAVKNSVLQSTLPLLSLIDMLLIARTDTNDTASLDRYSLGL